MLTCLFWSKNDFQRDFTSVRRVFKGKKDLSMYRFLIKSKIKKF